MSQKGETLTFPNNGVGTFIYTDKISDNFSFEVYLTLKKIIDENPPSDEFIKLRVDSNGFKISIKFSDSSEDVLLHSSEPMKGIETQKTASYWFSVDRDGFMIRYGKGYIMLQTTCGTIDFTDKRYQDKLEKVQTTFCNPEKPLYLMVFSIGMKSSHNPLIESELMFQFKKYPLTGNRSPVIKDSSKVTMFDLDRGEFTFSDDLPLACRELYNIIKGLDLEFPENPAMKLSDAMRFSLDTEGKFLNQILESKKGEFGDPSEVYIRVTLGRDLRTGPGIPFVLEIWPTGCRSPIHNHGSACAIIKVLFGQIQISIYNKATNPPTEMDPLFKFDAKQGDATWMDDNWFQAHELKNTTNDFCATIQSYRYQVDDAIRWPGFDYIREGKVCEQDTFIPNSDATFIQMRQTVLQEYTDYLSGKTRN